MVLKISIPRLPLGYANVPRNNFFAQIHANFQNLLLRSFWNQKSRPESLDPRIAGPKIAGPKDP